MVERSSRRGEDGAGRELAEEGAVNGAEVGGGGGHCGSLVSFRIILEVWRKKRKRGWS